MNKRLFLFKMRRFEKKSVVPVAGQAAVKVKRIATDVWLYVYRKSVEVSKTLAN